MEVISADSQKEKLVATLGYKSEPNFDPLAGPKRTIASANTGEEAGKNAQRCLERVKRMLQRLKSRFV